MDDAQILALTDRFHAAAIGADTWAGALEAFAVLTGSRSGQIIGLGADATVPFNWITNFDAAAIAEFAAIGGGDPVANPRIRAGFTAPELVVLSDADYVTPDVRRKSEIFADFYTRWDIPFICHTNLVKQPDMVIGLSVNRSAREGDIDAEARRVFAAVAPHARAAVRTQLALEGRGAALIAGAMEALSMPVFVCDRAGRVIARTPQTEALLGAGGPLKVALRMLTARRRDDAERLARAIARAGQVQAMHGVAIAGAEDGAPLILDVAPLPPRAHGFSLEARVLVAVRVGQRDRNAQAAMAQAAFGLTPAEADIAVRLVAGETLDAIAAARLASLHTVRTQIKALYAKLGVARRSALQARLKGLG